jgi:hypothetical protein
MWKQAVAWLTPRDPWSQTAPKGAKERVMGKLPSKSEMADADDQPKIKKAQKIMKAVSAYAQKPKKKKFPKKSAKKSPKEGSPAEEAMETASEESKE